MTSNGTRSGSAEHGESRWRYPQWSAKARAAAVYAAVPQEKRAKLSKWRQADLHRSKSSGCSASPLERVLEQVMEIEQVCPGFADTVAAAVRSAAASTEAEPVDVLRVVREVLAAQRADVLEDANEVDVQAGGYMDRAELIRYADASSRAGLAEIRKAQIVRQYAETLAQ
jgi:hypothetical protein